MDVTLERILSLIPRKADGKYVHGAKKEFAESLNMAHNLVTMWERGQSSSYKNKLHEISAKYGVSVEWLKGETDIKKEPALPEESELSDLRKQAYALLDNVSEEKLAKRMAALEALFDD